jgi:hypothetical protein
MNTQLGFLVGGGSDRWEELGKRCEPRREVGEVRRKSSSKAHTLAEIRKEMGIEVARFAHQKEATTS